MSDSQIKYKVPFVMYFRGPNRGIVNPQGPVSSFFKVYGAEICILSK